MPLRKQGTFNRSLIALAASAATLVVPSLASAACPVLPTTQAFAAYGDTAQYALAPGGNFESSTTGWTFTNSGVVSGQGGLLGVAANVLSGLLGGKKSLSIGTNFLPGVATVTSPPICVDESNPYFRYMLKANTGAGSLTTSIIYTDAAGSQHTQTVPSATKTTLLPSQWKPSDLNPLALNIPLVQAGGTATVRLQFKSSISLLGAGYQIDNLLIDPYRRG